MVLHIFVFAKTCVCQAAVPIVRRHCATHNSAVIDGSPKRSSGVDRMAYTSLPADRLRSACEKAATRLKNANPAGVEAVLGILHLAAAALSVNANASLTITSEEFLWLAESW
jgi:hypothetical protein